MPSGTAGEKSFTSTAKRNVILGSCPTVTEQQFPSLAAAQKPYVAMTIAFKGN